MSHLGKILALGCCLLVRVGAASAPDKLADVIYHEHFKGVYDPGDEDVALRADGSAFSYLRFSAGRFTMPTTPGGEGSFTYTKTGPDSAQLVITDDAGKQVTRMLTFATDTTGTWVAAPGQTGDTFSLRPLFPNFPLVNSSSRTTIGPDRQSIFGFVVSGGNHWVLVRVVGPGLQPFGVSPVANAPVLELFNSAGVRYSTPVTHWDGNVDEIPLAPVFRFVGAFPLAAGSSDAASLFLLAPGAYTVRASTTGNTGEVLSEVYVLP